MCQSKRTSCARAPDSGHCGMSSMSCRTKMASLNDQGIRFLYKFRGEFCVFGPGLSPDSKK